jgi:hypothetical protein
VLGHLVLANDGTALKGNLSGASPRPLGAANPVLDFGEVALGGGEQILALASARDGEFGVAADDQPLAGTVIGWMLARSRSSNSESWKTPESTRRRICGAWNAVIQSITRDRTRFRQDVKYPRSARLNRRP